MKKGAKYLLIWTIIWATLTHCSMGKFYAAKFPRCFSACYKSAICLSMSIYKKNLKPAEDFCPNSRFDPWGNFFVEIGVYYRQIHNCGWCIETNITARHIYTFILTRGLKDMSQKPHFQRALTLPHPSHIIKKVGFWGLDWCYVGVEWRNVAEIG